jgi:hypothetical protein
MITKCHISLVRDFRPINLLGSIYKILAKVLAIRMKQVLDSLNSNNENAFRWRRQTLDSAIIANNTCLDIISKSRIHGVLCKLDFEKAYEHVKWDFLSYLLGCLGFGSKWRK